MIEKPCPNCGEKIIGNVKDCPHCGVGNVRAIRVITMFRNIILFYIIPVFALVAFSFYYANYAESGKGSVPDFVSYFVIPFGFVSIILEFFRKKLMKSSSSKKI